MTELPPLYKLTKTGATQLCRISFNNETFTVEFGQLNGKLQSKSTICYDTNLGRSNHRNPTQQAEFEARAKLQKKVDTGYLPYLPSAIPPDTNTVLLPQKVKKYQEQLHNIAPHVYVSDKLDGVNGIFRFDGTELLLYSRGGLLYPPLPHLSDGIMDIMRLNNFTALNVELYIHNTPLQTIQSAVKKPNSLSPSIQAHIFELPDEPGTYTHHLAKLEGINQLSYTPNIRLVQSKLVPREQIDSYFDSAISRGCEGLIIRNPTGVYKYNERSSDVFKYKVAQSGEFRIVGYHVDKNGHPVLHCMSDGGVFKFSPKGTSEERRAILDNIADYINKWYTVEFETFSIAGKPLKPVGVSLRACDANGDPLE